jgi:hypothetical protein
MKLKAVTAVLALFLLTSTAIAHAGKTATYEGTIDEVFDAAVKVAQSNWSVTYADRKTGTFSFNTGTSLTSNGMECSAILEEVPGTRVRVTLKTQKKNGQVIAWGVGDRIASKLFNGIGDEIGKQRAGRKASVSPQEASGVALTPRSLAVTPTQPASVAATQSASATPTRPPSSPSVQQATVEFWSSPAGADIEVDGKYIGSTPSTVTVQAGEHTITMRKQDFGTWQKTIKVTSGNLRVAAYMQQVGVTLH